MKNIFKRIKAAKEDKLITLAGNGTSLKAQENDDGKQPKISGVAYSGGKLSVAFWEYPVVVDLQGMEVPTDSIQLDADHSDRVRDRLGSVTASINNNQLEYEGKIISNSDAARNIVDHAKAGESWQVSIDARTMNDRLVAVGETEEVNGQEFEGPFFLVTESKLRKISVVTQGADANSNMDVAARNKQTNIGDGNMEREELIKGLLATETFSEDDRKTLEAKSDEQLKTLHAKLVETSGGGDNGGDSGDPGKKTGKDSGKDNGVKAKNPQQFDPDAVKTSVRKTVQAEEKRLDAVRATCHEYNGQVEAQKLNDLRDKAIKAEITQEKLELELLKASRPKAGANIQTGGNEAPAGQTIEAALAKTLQVNDVDKQYNEQTLEAADKMSKQGYGLKAFLQDAAAMNGSFERRVSDGNLRNVLQAAFSTNAASDILNNVANKVLRDAFTAVEQNWREVARIRSVNDFKEVEHHRLNGHFGFQKVGADGELKHGEVSEDKYTSQADTYGRMFSLTRKDIINDDLGAFEDLRQMIGRGAALKLNTEFWDTINNLSDSFFDQGKITTAGMDFDGLEKVYESFVSQTDAEGNPLGIEPQILLVARDLHVDARKLMAQTKLITGEDATMPDRHPFQGMFRVVHSQYLNVETSAIWYMLANPADLPLITVSFLNGRQEPFVESTEADFNQLGIRLRGYFDFGVDSADSQAAIRAEE